MNLLLAYLLSGSFAFAASVSLELPSTQILELAQSQKTKIVLVSDGTQPGRVRLSLDLKELSSLDPKGEVRAEIFPREVQLPSTAARISVELEFLTTSLAPSMDRVPLAIRLEGEGLRVSREFKLSVEAVHTIDVLDGKEGELFAFSTPEAPLRFRPHPQGLQVRFRNRSSRSLLIHASGAIPHQPFGRPLEPAPEAEPGPESIYLPPLIFSEAGDELEANYTIHDVYRPQRSATFNSLEP